MRIITHWVALVALLSGGVHWCWAQTGGKAKPFELLRAKATYEEQTEGIQRDAASRVQKLKTAYVSQLEVLTKGYKDKGDLEAVLAVNRELDRFKRVITVTGDDVALQPNDLAELQRRFVTADAKLHKDQEEKRIKLTQSYLAFLDNLKRELTKKGDMDGALAVREEAEPLRHVAELSALSPPDKPAPPAPVAAPPEKASGGIVVNPPGLKPFNNRIWIMATQDGFPAKDVNFMFVGRNGSHIHETRTDSMGKIDVRMEGGGPFRVLLMSPGLALQEISEAVPGNAYQVKVTPWQPGEGMVVVRDKQFTLPLAGSIQLNEWFGSDGSRGPALMGSRSVFLLNRQGGNRNNFVHAHYERPFWMVGDGKEYEATLYPIRPHDVFYIRYQLISRAKN